MSDLEERARQESRDILNPVTAPTVLESSNLLIELADRIATLEAESHEWKMRCQALEYEYDNLWKEKEAAEARLAKAEKAARPIADKFHARVQNPKDAEVRRNWNERMPGDWPMKLEITMAEGRALHSALSSTGGGDGLDIKRRPMDFALQETTDER